MSKLLKIIIPVLLLIDIAYSFAQHYHTSLDGDMAAIILPAEWYQQVLSDPFGLSILFNGEEYGGAGRFFCHWSMSVYFKKVPLLIQHFLNPIDSVYFSVAIIKTGIQILLIWLLAAFVSGTTNIRKGNFLIAALLVAPLFQTHGYSLYMGIIEKSPTYTFFYPLPIAFLLLFILPLFLLSFFRKKIKWYIFMFPLVLILPFSGPLIPAILLMVCPVFLFFYWRINEKLRFSKINVRLTALPKSAILSIVTLFILSAYSFYISRYNIENNMADMPLLERYMALFVGVFKQLTQKLGLPLLLVAILFNYWWINKNQQIESKKLQLILKYVGLFSIVYLLLLPLGGYRIYRAYVIRHDSMMPVTLCMVYMFGVSTFYLLKNISQKYKVKYVVGVAAFLLVYSAADLPNFDHNACEKNALRKIADSHQKILFLEKDCAVMAWGKTMNTDDSWLNMQLLKHWRVIDKDKLYYQN